VRALIATLASIPLALIPSSCAATSGNGWGEPRKDAGSPTGYYVPGDLDDALIELDRIMGAKGRDEVLKATEDGMIEYHHGLGMWLRNNWGLWGGSRLARYFNRLGIRHPDDMSGIILDSYWRKVHDRPIDLDGQVRHCLDYWKKARATEGG
jgi:hypothetical protein